jgi:hypothetical protein
MFCQAANYFNLEDRIVRFALDKHVSDFELPITGSQKQYVYEVFVNDAKVREFKQKMSQLVQFHMKRTLPHNLHHSSLPHNDYISQVKSIVKEEEFSELLVFLAKRGSALFKETVHDCSQIIERLIWEAVDRSHLSP